MTLPSESVRTSSAAPERAPDRAARLADAGRAWFSRWLISPLAGVTFGHWMRILADNRFRVAPIFWPRAAVTTLMSLGNSLDARREDRRFADELAAVEVERPLFVLGHYRSGTTHLHNLLAVDPACTYANNLAATYARTFLCTEQQKRRMGAKLTMRHRPQDNVKLDLEVPGEDELACCTLTGLSTHMAWHFPRRAAYYERYLTLEDATADERRRWKDGLVEFVRKLTLQSDGKRVVLKSPCHTARAALILEAFPDARFVHIHRDPYTVFSSTMKMERTVPPHFEYQRRDPRAVEPLVLRRFRRMYDALLRDRERIPAGQYHELGFDELVAAPLETLRATYAALDLGPFDRARQAVEAHLTSVADYRKNRYPDLSADVRARVVVAWAPYFDAFGYSR